MSASLVVTCLIAALLPEVAAANEPTSRGFTNSLGMAFVRVPAGEFWMGSTDDDAAGEADERPRHRVRLTRPYSLGAYEVTQAEYEQVAGENPSWFSPTGPGRERVREVDAGRLPVDFTTWNEAAAFCRRLGELPDERRAGRRYRLPTEAEWEYAARAGSETRYSYGDAPSAEYANINVGERDFDGRREGCTMPVGSYPPNAFGLYDTCGNVWEWCQDRYAADAYAAQSGSASAVIDPVGPLAGTGRVVRGGDWFHSARYGRTANRDFTRASRRDLGNGFRVVCETAE